MSPEHNRRPDTTESHAWDRLPAPRTGVSAAIAGTLATALVTALSLTVETWLPAHGVAMFYFLTVVAAAVAFGMQTGIVAAITAFLAYNYFFLAPTFTFRISDPRDLVSLLVFFAVAIATGSLAGRLREVAEQSRQRSRSLEIMNAFAMRLSSSGTADEVAEALSAEAGQITAKPALVLRVTSEGLSKETKSPDAEPLSTADWQAAERAVATRRNSYAVLPGWPGQQYEFRPVIARSTVAWLLAIHRAETTDVLDAMLDTMVHQAAIAMERLSFEAEKKAAEKEAETERLRSAMLSAVSHDIKTPLASIKGSVTSLRELGPKMSEESKAELLATIEEEAERLSRFVTNMLDMMRLQSSMAVAWDWVDLADTAAVSVSRARRLMAGANIILEVPKHAAVVRGDETLIEHVFQNVIENAVNFSPGGTEVRVLVRADEAGYVVVIEDTGTGIAPEELPHIFEKFYRGKEAKHSGSGLGLTICKDVMTALGGSIRAESPIANARGTRISLTFPVPAPEAAVENPQ